jgi:hypothetical protein
MTRKKFDGEIFFLIRLKKALYSQKYLFEKGGRGSEDTEKKN